nr:hypothetical protein [Leisingera methylohalidivorans]
MAIAAQPDSRKNNGSIADTLNGATVRIQAEAHIHCGRTKSAALKI